MAAVLPMMAARAAVAVARARAVVAWQGRRAAEEVGSARAASAAAAVATGAGADGPPTPSSTSGLARAGMFVRVQSGWGGGGEASGAGGKRSGTSIGKTRCRDFELQPSSFLRGVLLSFLSPSRHAGHETYTFERIHSRHTHCSLCYPTGERGAVLSLSLCSPSFAPAASVAVPPAPPCSLPPPACPPLPPALPRGTDRSARR